MGLRCLLLVLVPAFTVGWSCTSNSSCQLNGFCEQGVCKCDPQWVGANCSRLNTGASKAAYTGMTTDQSTWGGHPIFDPATKLWHGYFAEMTEHCSLSAWTTNSIICLLYTSPSPRDRQKSRMPSSA